MKRTAPLIFGICLAISLSGFVHADGFQSVQLIGRELSPGINLGDNTVGALFVGKFFDENYTTELGQFSVILDHNGENIEVCGGATELIRFKLIMSFNAGGRLVLVGPTSAGATAQWNWDDPECPYGNCPLISYGYYITLLNQADVNPGSVLWLCAQVAPDDAFIAKVSQFEVVKQRLGSYGVGFTGGSVSGWLVHTPVVSPAIFGTVDLQ